MSSTVKCDSCGCSPLKCHCEYFSPRVVHESDVKEKIIAAALELWRARNDLRPQLELGLKNDLFEACDELHKLDPNLTIDPREL